jgi:hypothetical protein
MADMCDPEPLVWNPLNLFPSGGWQPAVFLVPPIRAPQQTATHMKLIHKLRVPPMKDEDRCFYGEVGADGSIVSDVVQPRADTLPARPPSPEMSPLDVVGEQFRALQREDVSHAYRFVHENVVEQYSLDVDRYEQIFKGAAYDGLLGCASWKVTALTPSPIDDDRTVASMTVLSKPVPGCVRVAGVADQQGITWPAFYKWELRKQTDGCWMIENMMPEPPPIDTVATDATPLLASD